MKFFGLLTLVSFFPFRLNAQTGKVLLTDNKLKTKLDSAIQFASNTYLQNNNTNGVSIGVYNKGKIFSYNYGKTKLLTVDGFFSIGSVAKTFVTTILAQAVIDKKVKLEDDIRRFLPEKYPNLEYKKRPIRFVDLANHTSGIPSTIKQFPKNVQDSLRKLNVAGQVHFYSLYNQDSLLADLHNVKLDTLPSTKFSYSSSGMTLLILLLEKIYHQSYEQIVTTYLRTHLKMYDTKPFLSETEIKKTIQGYNSKSEPQQFFNLKGFYFGPTMNSTINDMLKYLKANLSEKDKAIKLTHQLTYGKKDEFGLGLGWMMDNTTNGDRYIYHDGNSKFGYNTLCIFYPKKELGFIIVVNDTIDQGKVGEIENNIEKALNRY